MSDGTPLPQGARASDAVTRPDIGPHENDGQRAKTVGNSGVWAFAEAWAQTSSSTGTPSTPAIRFMALTDPGFLPVSIAER